MNLPVDLRSDTVTRPTAGMRKAMAEAVVGDDVFGEDPTVRELEERTAGLLDKEAALFVPSGTMGNEIALRVHARAGQEVIVEELSHIYNSEAAGPAALSGLQLRPLATASGELDPGLVLRSLRTPDDPHDAPTGLVCVENTHNRQGGRVYPHASLEALARALKGRDIPLHMDGARLWNAAVASGRNAATLAAPADSVMVCYSKGLGAPVGSVLAGERGFIREARRERKRLGGGMRQAGILAAACLHALEHRLPRLAEDHARARRLAELAGPPAGVSILGGRPDTNIVFFRLPEDADPARVMDRLKDEGVWLLDFGGGYLRAMTHLDVDDEQVEFAGRVLQRVLARAPEAHSSPAA